MEQDDMLEAAQALHHLRSLDPPPIDPSENGYNYPPPIMQQQQPQFLSRVSSLPIVDTSIRSISSLYESTKSSSKVVQYSAEMLENNLRPLSKYFQGTQVVRGVDDFACRQLDRFKPLSDQLPRLPELDQSFPPPHVADLASDTAQNHLPKYRSRWQQVTAGAVAAAGAGAAVLSEESMKSLKYCLEWLQYATHQLRTHMAFIKSWLSSIVPDRALNLYDHQNSQQQTLTFPSLVSIKLDIANVLRRVIDVVGRYAGNVLRGDARTNVRMFILSLPNRWANLYTTTNTTNGQQFNQDAFEAERVHAFATEADDILCSIRSLFEHTITTAEDWLSALNRVPFASAFVPQHAHVEPNLYTTNNLEQLPSSPMLSYEMANLTLSSHQLNTPNNHLLPRPRSFGTCHADLALHGQKRRTVEDTSIVDVTPQESIFFGHCALKYNGYTASISGPALSAESYESGLNGNNGADEQTDHCPPSSLKKRKKDV